MKVMIKTILFCVVSFLIITWFSQPQIDKSVAFTEDTVIVTPSRITQTSPPCLQMFYNIEKFSKKYQIPRNYAFGIAYAETRYGGPFHWTYKHSQESFAGAIGPMQIMPSTADLMWPGKNISRKRLMQDIAFNVETSMKLLQKLHNKYGDWKTVFGAYNTGRPCVNGYAIMVYNYKPKFQEQ